MIKNTKTMNNLNLMLNGFGRLGMTSQFGSQLADDITITPCTTLPEINYVEDHSYVEYNNYVSSLSPQQQKMLKNGQASIKQWGEGEYEFIQEIEPDEDGPRKYRNNEEQKIAMHRKQTAARRKKNKMKPKNRRKK